MALKKAGAALMALTFAIPTLPAPALAGGGDVVGGLLGGLVAGAIITEGQRNRRTTTGTGVSSAQYQENVKVQTALNYFGFPCGTPDGVFGRNTKGAISQYQLSMGYPATGQLGDYERQFLLTSYDRAQAGGASTAALIATFPDGPRGLLIAYRDEAAAAALPAAQAGAAANPIVDAAAGQGQQPLAPIAGGGAAASAVQDASVTTGLPNFMGNGAQESLASYCNKVSLMTNSNGGFVTLANMSDPGQVLDEQFCLARTYAIAEGEEMIAGLAGVTPAEVAQQCQSFGPTMQAYVTELSTTPMDAVLKDVSGFAIQNAMSASAMTGTAKICLSVGYRTDDLEIALGSALLLHALGQPVYGELMGHHLMHGFGVDERADLALNWYKAALDALAQGAQPAFAPGQSDRAALIRAAAFAPTSGMAPAAQPVSATGGSGLPSFPVSK